MKPDTSFLFLPSLLLLSACVVSGCSGSSESVDSDAQSSINAFTPVTGVSDDNGSPNANNEDDAANRSPVVEDPLIQNTLPVTFDITVPFYLSNELSLELVWGDINLTAQWVGGQMWSATSEFPTGTTHPLTLTFYDRFGDIKLAEYHENYTTGANATDGVQIQAEQFDATLFDSDEDGVSNLDELNAGTDPLADQDSLLEIVDTFALSTYYSRYSRFSASQIFESLIPEDRPYMGIFETEPELNTTLFGKFNVIVDADGNGTVDVNSDETPRRFLPRLSATRVSTNRSVFWAGELVTSDSDYMHLETVSNTVSVIDENLHSFVQEITGRNSGTYQFSWESSANLTGRLIERSSLCEPVAGTFSVTQRSNFSGHPTNTTDTTALVTTVSKLMDDPYWRVVITRPDSEIVEYFARELSVLYDINDDDSDFFTCDFVDF